MLIKYDNELVAYEKEMVVYNAYKKEKDKYDEELKKYKAEVEKYNKAKKKYESDLKKSQKDTHVIEENLEKLCTEARFPYKYLNHLSAIIELIEDYRADSLKEAINLHFQIEHQMRIGHKLDCICSTIDCIFDSIEEIEKSITR